MEEALRQKIEENLFPASRPAVEPWDDFPWHWRRGGIDTWQINSSQALAIDLFGTLKSCSSGKRNSILNDWAVGLGLSPAEDWTVELEWNDPDNRLNEKGQPTQVDAIARSDDSLIFFECKFTERDGGCCSRCRPLDKGLHRGQSECDGRYAPQINPIRPQLESNRCALSGRGTRYWEIVPSVLNLPNDQDHDPCPFKGPWYQWMRNLTVAWEVARTQDRKPAFVVVYADAPNLSMARKIRSEEWINFIGKVRSDQIRLETISYQQLIQRAQESILATGETDETWKGLNWWVTGKINQVSQRLEDRASMKKLNGL